MVDGGGGGLVLDALQAQVALLVAVAGVCPLALEAQGLGADGDSVGLVLEHSLGSLLCELGFRNEGGAVGWLRLVWRLEQLRACEDRHTRGWASCGSVGPARRRRRACRAPRRVRA